MARSLLKYAMWVMWVGGALLTFLTTMMIAFGALRLGAWAAAYGVSILFAPARAMRDTGRRWISEVWRAAAGVYWIILILAVLLKIAYK
ncbi:MAG: hypothetical protein K8R88_07975 [Armatimonadetes bacterium]|nr:hypothetical protein [Armatimonadota bacterium]